jgi:hypothetical protein
MPLDRWTGLFSKHVPPPSIATSLKGPDFGDAASVGIINIHTTSTQKWVKNQTKSNTYIVWKSSGEQNSETIYEEHPKGKKVRFQSKVSNSKFCHFKGTILVLSLIVPSVGFAHCIYIFFVYALCEKAYSLTPRYWIQWFVFSDKFFLRIFFFTTFKIDYLKKNMLGKNCKLIMKKLKKKGRKNAPIRF